MSFFPNEKTKSPKEKKCLTFYLTPLVWNMDVGPGVAGATSQAWYKAWDQEWQSRKRGKDCVLRGIMEPLCQLWIARLWTAHVGNNPHLLKPLMDNFLLCAPKGIPTDTK